MGSIINENDVLDVPVEDSQVLHEHFLLIGDTVLPTESMVDDIVVWVNLVENSSCITIVRCGEHDYLRHGF